jgi:hypothetical protein
MNSLTSLVKKEIADLPICDIHTHLYDPAIGSSLLSGVDELLTYHYLTAEALRARPDLAPETFWAMRKPDQADLIWSELFVRRAPLSEACLGLCTVFQAFGLDPRARSLDEARAFFSALSLKERVDRTLKLAGLTRLYMTNDPMDDEERQAWQKGFERDPRFLGVLRLDSALIGWPEPVPQLRALGYEVDEALSGRTLEQIRRYLRDWCARFDARYLAISLPPTFRYPDVESPLVNLLIKAAVPIAEELGIPLALMIGVRRLANPALRLAGDSGGAGSVESVEALARDFPRVRWLITMLARENQHGLCVAARKFSNLRVFGCWWFLNTASLIRELTTMRIELLGLSFLPQHSDARILEQVIYKWELSRRVIGEVLAARYEDLARSGWTATREEIRRDLNLLFDGRELEPRR